ncbi:MAG: leucine-rich repeat domain-containing protein, partial [Muribaculaceae bacterium]|nr:leucine-rich repeat domain-containing protein [Muribaculaceae bacterium]
MDVDHVGASFTVRAGSLKNISNSDFSGKLAVALFDAAGNRKCLLSDSRNFSLVALQVHKYVDYTCSLPAGTSVADGDVVRLVTMANGSSEWLPVAGDLLAPGHAVANDYDVPYFSISLPETSADAVLTASASSVIKGRDFSFTVVPMSVDKVITVKANGFILTPDASNGYRISNVLEDQKIDILVQNAADVLSKSTLWVTAGNLENLLSEQEAATVVDLTLFGTINANDFNFMRDRMKLERLDLSQVSIVAQGSNPANAIPAKAFMGYRSLKQIILPANLTTFKSGCFGLSGLTSVEIPASVATWEYNVFANCTSLREVTVRRSVPAWINWCVFTNTPQAKLTVPVGATAAYKAKEYWQDFKEIVEENPVAADHYSVSVAERKGVRFNAVSEGSEFEPGASYSFTVETDDSFGDATMQVFANAERLYPDASGNYNARIGANTLIHFEFSYPESTTPDKTWFLTGADGGVGLVTDVVNVPVAKSFIVRANAIKVPAGADASKFYAMALTDKDGAIKEIISPVITNYMANSGNLTCNFSCQVKESAVREGNELRLITSYNKKTWNTVQADAAGVTDRISAVGNKVVYHNVTMPQSMAGADIEGAVTEIVRGMPLNLKVKPQSPNHRVTLAINGVNKAFSAAIANVSVPSVTEDLDITILIHEAGESDYMVVNVQEGELAAKIAECPDRLKVVGTMLADEFDAFRTHAGNIIDLDLADVTIKGSAMNRNAIPSNAFAPTQSAGTSALRSIILPRDLERISDNAFARCTALKEVTIPSGVTYIGTGAFSSCTSLSTITMEGSTPPATGQMSPFPSNATGISLV